LPGQQAQREELQAEHEADRSLQVRYLGLKDIQVSKLTDRRGQPRFRLIEFPLRPEPGDRSANDAFGDQLDARKNRCGKLGLSASAGGEITYAEGVAAPGQCWQKQHPGERWVFTVSGRSIPASRSRPSGGGLASRQHRR